MAQLAIKGHPTRGKEVIQLLEMLGGVNYYGLEGTTNNCPYYIYNNKIHQWNEDANVENVIVFTLEEFEKKFPYKVGDKVTLDKSPCIITEMYWDYYDVIYYVSGDDFSKGVFSTDKDLQPYKEETIEESIDKTNKVIFETNAQCCDIRNEIIKKDIKQTLKDKLKDCDKEVLIDIIAEVCNIYVGARIFSDMSSANCIQQCVNNVQTNFQEVDNFITQRINTNFKNGK